MNQYSIVTVDADNVDQYGLFCVGNKRHPGYAAKREWLQTRFNEGLRIKLAMTGNGQHAGFMEYAPGEHTWRTVNAPGYLVIHCFWVKSARYRGLGIAEALLDSGMEDARAMDKTGLAVVASDGTWMASRTVYLKHGFAQVDAADPHFQLLVKQLRAGVLPSFPDDWNGRMSDDNRLRLLYTNQCPYIGKVVPKLSPIAQQHGIELHVTELAEPAQARAVMPSPYGVFALVHSGRLLADHPIGETRFRNILRKDLGLARRPATA